MPLEVWIQHSRLDQFLYDWQTLIAGILALLAGFGTVAATMIIAHRQIVASREEADRVVATTREQTETTVRLEQERVASEASAFRAMLEAAMARVLDEVDWARQTYPQLMKENDTPQSREAFTARNSITRGAFAELRAACVRQDSPLTGEFLGLEREIENFAMQWVDIKTAEGAVIRHGWHAGLGDQLTVIENKANELRQKAAEK